jgi:hypothetical protein
MAFLDDLDGDPDLEENGDDEPTLGWPSRGPVSGGTGQDGEEEPSLGWTASMRQEGKNWSGDDIANGSGHAGYLIDVELDDADKEPSLAAAERHPSAGWGMATGSQVHWAAGDGRDLEDQCEDEGATERTTD